MKKSSLGVLTVITAAAIIIAPSTEAKIEKPKGDNGGITIFGKVNPGG